MDSRLIQSIQEAAIAAFPHEACGFVLAGKAKPEVMVCRNVAESPTTEFVIHEQDYLTAWDHHTVIGVWHTHVDSSPRASDADLAGCENSGMPWFILAVHQRLDGLWDFDGPVTIQPTGFEMPYIGRPYLWKTFDCWTLVRDWYRREHGIILGERPRVERYWEQGYNLLGDNWESEGFFLVNTDEYLAGDVLLLGSPIHNSVVLCLGGSRLLYHFQGRLSRTEELDARMLKLVKLHLRHKEIRC